MLKPYDKCIVNETIKGSQCTIVWYVDSNIISHFSPYVVSSIIKIIEKKFGKLEVTRGDKHNFLGMDVNFKKNGTVERNIKDYILEAFKTFG